MIKRRGNSWWVVVYTGRDPLTGKKRQKTGTARTRAEARQLEARLLQESAAGRHRGGGTRTVAELLEAWYAWRPRARPISPRTLATYRSYIDHKIVPGLGKLPLARVTTATVDQFLTQGACPRHRLRPWLAHVPKRSARRPRHPVGRVQARRGVGLAQ
jgi:integrase